MAAPEVHRVGDEFEDRNMFLQVTLGLISMTKRFEELLARYGRRPAGLELSDGEQTDPALFPAPGAVSFARRLDLHVATAVVHQQGHDEPIVPPVPGTRVPRRLLE